MKYYETFMSYVLDFFIRAYSRIQVETLDIHSVLLDKDQTLKNRGKPMPYEERHYKSAAKLIMKANDIDSYELDLIVLFNDERALNNDAFVLNWLKAEHWRCQNDAEPFRLDLLSQKLRNKIRDKFSELEDVQNN